MGNEEVVELLKRILVQLEDIYSKLDRISCGTDLADIEGAIKRLQK